MTGKLIIRLITIITVASYVSVRAEWSLLTINEARRVVNEALPKETKRLPGLTLWLSEKDQAKPARCFTFDVLWSNPGPGSVHVGFWTVDRRTGEVWTPIQCERITTASLGKLQQSIRRRLGVTKGEWQEALKHSPCCLPEK